MPSGWPALRGVDLSEGVTLDADEFEEEPSAAVLDFELNFSEDPDAQLLLHTLAPPELPGSLSPGQAAQLAEMLQYINLRMRALIQSVRSKAKGDRVTLEQREWQNLIDLEDRSGRAICAGSASRGNDDLGEVSAK